MTGTALLLAIAAGACVLTDASSIELSRDELKLGDFAILDCVAGNERAALADTVVAVLAENQTVELPRQALAALARRRVPGLVLRPTSLDLVRIMRQADPVEATPLDCYAAAAPIARGAPVTGDLVEHVACARPTEAVRYDRRYGLTRAAANIEAGQYLGRILLSAPVAADAGEELTLSFAIGNVIVERRVEALQPSTGEAIFVRDADGGVFAASLPEENQR